MDFFGDFCLVCDKQTNGTPFCSQACRLAELDQSLSSSEPSSPVFARHETSQGTSRQMLRPAMTGFQLLPAIDFMSYRRNRKPRPSSTQLDKTTPLLTTKISMPVETPRSSNLTPSSSQTSLSSLRTHSTSSGGISEQAWNELRNYASSFDQVRTLKRRMSSL